jgi:hypothetical protein
MRRAIAFLTLIIPIMIAADIVSSIPVTSVNIYSIYISRIDLMGAAPGNSNGAVISVNVTELGGYACGLDINNFKLDTLKAPFFGQNIAINSVRESAAAHGQPHAPCTYSINIAPAGNRDGQYTWGKGTYILQLNYIKGGRQLAIKTFNFTVLQSLYDSRNSDQLSLNLN